MKIFLQTKNKINMKTKKTFLIMAFSLMAFAANAQLQYISNITVVQRADASGLVDVHFDLVAQPNEYYIYMEASFDAGDTFTPVLHQYTSGDIGPISPGTGYHIVWDGLHSFPETYGPQSQLRINAVSCPETVTDIDGNTYQTVPIGGQCWMKENLNVTKNPAGTSITRYCYDDNTNNCDTYGGLYTWDVMMNGSSSSNNIPSGVQGICPIGWHIPSDAEWTVLTDYLGGASVAGGKMKEAGTAHWNLPNTGATNSSGFTGLPGGYRNYNGTFGYIGNTGFWWSSNEEGTSIAWFRAMSHTNAALTRNPNYMNYGLSVRCLRD